MTEKLKSLKLVRAENLSVETRKKYNLPDNGLVALEVWQKQEIEK